MLWEAASTPVQILYPRTKRRSSRQDRFSRSGNFVSEAYLELDPAPHACLVPEVPLAEDTLQVALLAFDHPAPYGDEDEGSSRADGEGGNPTVEKS